MISLLEIQLSEYFKIKVSKFNSTFPDSKASYIDKIKQLEMELEKERSLKPASNIVAGSAVGANMMGSCSNISLQLSDKYEEMPREF